MKTFFFASLCVLIASITLWLHQDNMRLSLVRLNALNSVVGSQSAEERAIVLLGPLLQVTAYPYTALATAYSCGDLPSEAMRILNCPNGRTATGTQPKPGTTIACPPELVGKRLEFADLGTRICEDTGGAITAGRIDIYLPTFAEAMRWGIRSVPYRIID